MAADKNEIIEMLSRAMERTEIIDDPVTLSSYKSAGLITGDLPVASVRPSSSRDVQSIVSLAGREGINLIFSSSAPPRFRGDTVPDGNTVIVDMSGLNGIVRIDRRNKVALIEPGVTYQNLINEAGKAGLKVLMPLLPRSGKSVIASYLEREPLLIPKYHWDMTDPMLCAELIFGTGDLFRTGSAGSPGTLEQQWAAGNVQKNPLGPGQTDFLRIVQGSQGTMAAVTWASVKLEVKPQIHNTYFISEPEPEKLIDFSYTALKRKICDEFFIVNSTALSTMIPKEAGGIEPGCYVLVYGVSGYECLPRERVGFVLHDLGELTREYGLNAVSELRGVSSELFESIIASPSGDPYYKTTPAGSFVDIFFLTTLDRSPLFINVMEDVAQKHGYPKERIGIYIQPIQQGRTIHLEFTVYYDDTNESDKVRTGKLFTEACDALFKAGAFFSRPYGSWAGLAYSRCPGTVDALNKIKRMLDPDGILNRRKLCFKEAG